MTQREMMAPWRRVNRRIGLLVVMPGAFIVGFAGVAPEVNHAAHWLAWMGAIIAASLASLRYGEVLDEMVDTSMDLNDHKLERLLEDLGPLAENLPFMKISAHQEMGNVHWPARLVFVVKGVPHPITYNWKSGRFGRYKWPFLPFSIEQALERAHATHLTQTHDS